MSWNPIADLAQSFKEGWEWWSGGFANPVVYRGFEPPKPGPAPGVPSGAYVPPYSPSSQEVIASQQGVMETWRVDAITPPKGDEDNTWMLIAGGLILFVVLRK